MSIVYRPQIGGLDAVSLVTIDPTPNGLSIDSSQVLSLALSSTSTTGALSSTDWNTFNSKQAAGNYITALTGDATASGPGSVALTLATVNSNVGSFGGATAVSAITVNAKGLITAASSTSIQITESQVTNLTSDLALKAPLASPALTGVPTAPTASQGNNSTQLATTAYVDTGLATKQATGNYITALTGDITASGPGSVAATLATVNSNVGSFTNANITVNAKGLITAASNGSAGTGTVTSVSVVSANGFAGTVATATTTPAITLTTTITGILQGNGTAISAASTTGTGAVVLAGSPTFTGVPVTSALTLTPQAADPGSPTAGEIQYADGTARAAGPWYYTGSAWAPVGANAGFIATDWTAYTPTFTGFGTVSTQTFYWRRLGDSIDIRGYWLSGTATAVQAKVSLPTGLTMNSAKLSLSQSPFLGIIVGGITSANTAISGTSRGPWGVMYDSDDNTTMSFGLGVDTDEAVFTPANGNAMSASGNAQSMTVTGIPITQYSANTVAAVQSINARAHNSSTTISSSLATIVWTTEDYDTDSALSSGVFTAPSSGKYQVNAALATSGTFVLNNTSIMQLQVNGTAVTDITHFSAAAVTNESVQLSDTINVSANDTIRIQYSTQGTGPAIVNSNTKNYFSISKIGN